MSARDELNKKYGGAKSPTMTVRQRLEQKYGRPEVQAARPVMAVQPTPAPALIEKKGFFSNLKDSLGKRATSIKETFKDTAQGKINPLETGLQTVGAIAGGVNDIAGAVVGKAIGAANTLSGGNLKKLGENILQTDLGREGLKVAAKGMEEYGKWKANNPRTAKDLESVVNIATLFPVSKGAQIAGRATAKTAQVTGKGIAKTGKAVGEAGKVTTASVTGLSKDTINTLIKNPKAVTAAQKAELDASSLGNKVKSALDKRIADLRSTGKKYETVRRSSDKVVLPEDILSKTLNKYGIGLDSKGKIKTSVESVPLKAGDKKELQDFIDLFGKEKELSGNAFMNARTSLTNLSGFGTDKSDISKVIAKELRKEYDNLGKSQLKGLKELDAKYSVEKGDLSKIKKEYIDKDGNLKDSALSKIANATNEGRQQVLGRLEKLIPGITEEINIYKAVRDIEAVKGQKVGAYASNALRSGVGGFAVSGGNVGGAIAGAIISHPSVAVPIIKAYGRIKNVNKKAVDNIINKMKGGKALLDKEKKFINKAIVNASGKFTDKVLDKTKNIKPGLTIDDVSKKPGFKLIQEAKNYKSAEEFADAYAPGKSIELEDRVPNDLMFIFNGAYRDSFGQELPEKFFSGWEGIKLKDLYNELDIAGTADEIISESTIKIKKAGYGKIGEVFITDDGIKTKSQLEEIWKKANKLK